MVNQISVSSIKIIEEFRVISSTSPGELEVGVKVLSEKLNERPSFDCDPITCWKSPSDEIFLIGGSYVLDSYKQSNREKIPVILNDCNGAKNFPQVRSWMFINVDAELYTPLSTKDKKSAFCEFALLPENLNKTYQEISSELDIPLGTIKAWGSQLGLKQKKKEVIHSLSQQKLLKKFSTKQIEEELRTRKDLIPELLKLFK